MVLCGPLGKDQPTAMDLRHGALHPRVDARNSETSYRRAPPGAGAESPAERSLRNAPVFRSLFGTRSPARRPGTSRVGGRIMEKKTNSPTARGLSRSQAAEILGVTEREISKMDGRQLNPRRAADRRWVYDISEIRALLDGRGAHGAASPARTIVDGDISAAAFELFEAGETLPQVVIATRQTAATILHLRADYDGMLGSMSLSAKAVARLRKMLGDSSWDGDGLVDAVDRALVRSFNEGRAEATDCGQVLDRTTGKMRPIPPPQTWREIHPMAMADGEHASTGPGDPQPPTALPPTPTTPGTSAAESEARRPSAETTPDEQNPGAMVRDGRPQA